MSRTFPELQVDTEQRKNFVFIAIGLRHIEHTAKVSGMASSVPAPVAAGVPSVRRTPAPRPDRIRKGGADVVPAS